MDAAFERINYPLVAMQTAIASWRPPARNVGQILRAQATGMTIVGGFAIVGQSAYQSAWGWRDPGKRYIMEPGRYVDTWV